MAADTPTHNQHAAQLCRGDKCGTLTAPPCPTTQPTPAKLLDTQTIGQHHNWMTACALQQQVLPPCACHTTTRACSSSAAPLRCSRIHASRRQPDQLTSAPTSTSHQAHAVEPKLGHPHPPFETLRSLRRPCSEAPALLPLLARCRPHHAPTSL
jgi:hypothetical protein